MTDLAELEHLRDVKKQPCPGLNVTNFNPPTFNFPLKDLTSFRRIQTVFKDHEKYYHR